MAIFAQSSTKSTFMALYFARAKFTSLCRKYSSAIISCNLATKWNDFLLGRGTKRHEIWDLRVLGKIISMINVEQEGSRRLGLEGVGNASGKHNLLLPPPHARSTSTRSNARWSDLCWDCRPWRCRQRSKRCNGLGRMKRGKISQRCPSLKT